MSVRLCVAPWCGPRRWCGTWTVAPAGTGWSVHAEPDLRVRLSDQPVLGGRQGWRVFDDGRWLELGRLKGNRGGQMYATRPAPTSTG
ncbi:hypothetical protein Ari01nite_93490 [Paractinoplanes rishiriensis]|uniref:Uncharacterized protein n=1 Tax=Paractinoplanes rishiriensis TaxID=1050105 RepID=A0A919KAS4_9ACTN|nr:hypothetical protein Ari01nite_93490 [Actinoplanes rishiriensis]